MSIYAMKKKNKLKVVADTNIVIASEKSISDTSPNKEFFDRWKKYEFDILYSDDILLEYIEKLRHFNVPDELIKKLIIQLLNLEFLILIDIKFFTFLSFRLILKILLFSFVLIMGMHHI